MSEFEFRQINGKNTVVLDFYQSNNQIDVIQGPLGSGKTAACCLRIMRHAQEQVKSPVDGIRHSRWAIVRNTYPQLRTSTLRTWLEIFKPEVYGRFNYGVPLHHDIKFGDVDLTVDFLSLDKEEDVRKLRSTEYTGVYFNELQYILRELFTEARSRIRYPSMMHGGPNPWGGVIADANAPDEDHWLAIMTKQVELPPGLSQDELSSYQWPPSWGFYMQPAALLERRDERGNIVRYDMNTLADNIQNLPKHYYEDLVTVAPSKAWIDSRLMNRVALVVDGSPVWPMFRREFHVAREALKPVEGCDVQIAIDPGRVYPAVLFAQEVNQKICIQYEMLGFNEPASVFAPKVKRFLAQHYPNYRYRFIGDPAVTHKSQVNEESFQSVFRSFGMPIVPAPLKSNNTDSAIAERTEAVAYVLNDNPSGNPRLLISPNCRTLIIGMAGRYHLTKEDDGEFRPKKDKYSNLCDALQYLCIGMGEGRRMLGQQPLGELKPKMFYRGHKSMRRVMA